MEERVLNICISELHPFPNHPFKVPDDESMKETVDSVKEYGVLVPIIVRERESGGYEIISGHRRKRACEIAEMDTIPAIVRNLDDDSAVIVMVDANLQRESILPSERAMAYKMKLEAINGQAGRPSKENEGQVVGNLESAEIVGQEIGESGRQIQRYIGLTELEPELQQMVDEKKIGLTPAVEISYLKPEVTGYRARAGFAKFFNLPELMKLFKEAADIKTSDGLSLPVQESVYHNEHPQSKDGFAGIDVNGSFYTEKENVSNALLEAVKDSVGCEAVSIGRYRGFGMSVMLADFGRQYVLTLKGEISHHVELGKDARGNLIRMDNTLNQIPLKIESAKGQLETAKSEVEKPFPQEDELRAKSARLVQLNTELDINGKESVSINTDTVSKDTTSAPPKKDSILTKLHTPLEQHAAYKVLNLVDWRRAAFE